MKDTRNKCNLIMNLSKFIFNLKKKKKKKTKTNFITKLSPFSFHEYFTVHSKNFIKGFILKPFYFKKESLFFFYPIFVSKEKLFAFTKFSIKKRTSLGTKKQN